MTCAKETATFFAATVILSFLLMVTGSTRVQKVSKMGAKIVLVGQATQGT